MKLGCLLIFLLTFCGCVLPTAQPPVCEEFFNLPTLRDEYDKFKGYPIEAKLEIYLCGMERHPKRHGFAAEIASEGPKNVPFLLEKLRAETSEGRKSDIIYIFEAMAKQGGLTGRQDVLRELERQAGELKLKVYRERSQESLRAVRGRILQLEP